MENNENMQEEVPAKKKLVVRRKPSVRAVVKKAVAEVAPEAPAEKAVPEVAPATEAVAEPSAAEPAAAEPVAAEPAASAEAAPKPRRGRPSTKGKKTAKKAEGTETPASKASEAEAAPAPATENAEAAPAPAPEGASENMAAAEGGEKAQEQVKQNSNYQKKNKNGRQNFQQQKKTPLTMEDVAVSEEEYNASLPNSLLVSSLSNHHMADLKERLSAMTGNPVDDYAEYKKQEVIMEILRTHSHQGGVIIARGTLEVLPDGYGFLRSPSNSYLSGPEDVYVNAGLIRFLNLKTGDTIEGVIRSPKDNERFFAMAKVAYVNGDLPIVAKTRNSFDSLIPLYPDSRINLETERADDDVSMRIINLFCPIGKGQRALITAPPRTGKTILLQQIANAITTNHPEIHLIVLLVDERPEEVTDMRRSVRGEVIASTFDEQATRHVQVAEMVIEKAKRLVEHKRDVVILLDSITRLARAYNQTVPASGKILSGGVDSNALHKPKRFFGAARNIENGGSLTIIASALIETGSRMDEVIFEEFKGTGNCEIVLDRMMAERRLFPAINIKKSGTRREDLLLEQDEANKIWILRNNVLNGLEDYDITRLLVDKMRKTKNNEAFLRSMNTGAVPVT